MPWVKLKNKIRLWTMPVLLAIAALVLSAAGAFAAETALPPVPVNIGHHGNYTRIVFEFPKLFAYHVKENGAQVMIDFDTKAAAGFSALKSPLVKSIKDVSDGAGLKISMDLAAGSTIKHYRLKRKIILDVYSADSPPKEPPAAQKPSEKDPVKTAEATPSANPALSASPAAAEKEAPPKEIPGVLSDPAALAAKKIPKTVPAPTLSPAEKAPARPAAVQTAPPHTEEHYSTPWSTTTIALSSLLPMRLAVFERFGTLWIVTDSDSASAAEPVITGPMKEFIAAPKILRFKGGMAYRYTFPQKIYPLIQKQNLLWKISLPESPSAGKEAPGGERRNVQVKFDPVSRKAKLMAPLQGAGDALTIEDPAVGDTLYVVPTNSPNQAITTPRIMTDLEIVPALLGMVVRPLQDAVSAFTVNDFVMLTAPAGLAVTPEGVGTPLLAGATEAAADDVNNRLFDFPNWRQGGIGQFRENKQRIQEEIVSAASPEDRAGQLMKLALLYFSNNFGHEALGLLDLLLQENPEMDKNTDFIAIRGAANAMAGHYTEALRDLSTPAIQQHPEVNLWIGFAAAATEQWRMADRSFPKNNRLLLGYPDNIAVPLTLYMAESALRLGHTDTAKQMLDSINMPADALDPRQSAAIGYLRGEAFFQQGKLDEAETTWLPVAKGIDRLYHTKASLALTKQQLKQGKIPLKEAIEQLENLRFAWRGDGLEVSILATLGGLKVRDNRILSGMEDMKRAADLSDSLLDDSTYIREEMKSIFADLFVGDKAGKISPLEAVSVFTAFDTLLPPGAEGVAATLDFADYLIRMDLLGKSAEILEGQISGGALTEDKIASVGTKLAAVYLLDSRPQEALEALMKTNKGGPTEQTREERSLLKARAQSLLKQTDAAIDTLSTLGSRNAKRLKADVLWRAGRWNDAALTIETLLPPATAARLEEEDAALVVNAAVAWKLAGNADSLKKIREKYAATMAATKLAQTFGVVTRDGGASALADRETMLRISGEVDMFKGFLDSYKAGSGKGS